MGLTEKLDLIEKYYYKSTLSRMKYDRRVLCTKMLQCGLTPAQIMDAIDAAVLRYGLDGVERDYWDTIRKECRKVYRDLVEQDLIETREKANT